MLLKYVHDANMHTDEGTLERSWLFGFEFIDITLCVCVCNGLEEKNELRVQLNGIVHKRWIEKTTKIERERARYLKTVTNVMETVML